MAFAELLPDTSADAIARRWQAGGADPAPLAPLGTSVDGRVDVDLVRDGPHGLIAGTTGAGKSELLRTLVLSLAASVGPEHLNFVLVDYNDPGDGRSASPSSRSASRAASWMPCRRRVTWLP